VLDVNSLLGSSEGGPQVFDLGVQQGSDLEQLLDRPKAVLTLNLEVFDNPETVLTLNLEVFDNPETVLTLNLEVFDNPETVLTLNLEVFDNPKSVLVLDLEIVDQSGLALGSSHQLKPLTQSLENPWHGVVRPLGRQQRQNCVRYLVAHADDTESVAVLETDRWISLNEFAPQHVYSEIIPRLGDVVQQYDPAERHLRQPILEVVFDSIVGMQSIDV